MTRFLILMAFLFGATESHAHGRHRAPAATPSFLSLFQVVPHVRHTSHYSRRLVRAVRSVPAPGLASADIVETARSQIGNGPIYGRRNLWCARFVNYVLERSGHKGTGSDLAWSFASLPRGEMHVGAIAVMPHHVGVVSGVTRDGNPILISGNNAGRVREAAYPRRRVAAFVEVR